jgi:rubrerythrin
MGQWRLDDIPWHELDRSKLTPDLTAIVKAACMVEHHAADYGTYLGNVFHDDLDFVAAARAWAVEEVQHGQALRRYAELADPSFDFDDAFGRFVAGHRLPLDVSESVRGSRCGELIARCIVEAGTSSYYSALEDSVEEPVLKLLCAKIAGDEFRHYKLFYSHMKRYQKSERLSLFARARVAFGRLFESRDDELGYAYYCGSGDTAPYDRGRCIRSYVRFTLPRYRFGHVERGFAMVLKAIGLKPQSFLGRNLTKLAWWFLQQQARRLQASA